MKVHTFWPFNHQKQFFCPEERLPHLSLLLLFCGNLRWETRKKFPNNSIQKQKTGQTIPYTRDMTRSDNAAFSICHNFWISYLFQLTKKQMENKIKMLEKSLKLLTKQMENSSGQRQQLRIRVGILEDAERVSSRKIQINSRDITSNNNLQQTISSRLDQMKDAVRVNTGMILANTRDMQSLERDIQNLQESASSNKTGVALHGQGMDVLAYWINEWTEGK